MRDDDPLKRTIADWEQKFTNRWYLQPVGHGDLSQMDREVWGWQFRLPNEQARYEAYANMVSAVLLRWDEIKRVSNEPHFSNPIYLVSKMAFQQIGPDSPKVVYKNLQSQFDRLWLESPRPHDEELRSLMLSFGGYLPVTQAEVGLLFEQPGWAIPCILTASSKGWLNHSISMMYSLKDKEVKLDSFTIASFVDKGFPKRQALKWLGVFDQDKESVGLHRALWEAELKADGMTLEQIYAHDG